MKKIEILIMSLLFVGGVVAIFLPNIKPNPKIVGEEELLNNLNKKERYISTDELAQVLMEGDQSYMLIDIRSSKEFEKYSIETAFNVPFDSIMNKNNLLLFDQNENTRTVVIYSTGTSKADRTWLKLLSFNYKNVKVLKGGLNRWYQTILNPQKPTNKLLTGKLEDQYLFRKGAQVYFTGANPIGNTGATKPKKSNNKPVMKPKKKEDQGGC